jgi:hypothetical protein
MDVCLYVATEPSDPESIAIRLLTNCDWSHVGFMRLADKMTYSSMADGRGLDFRPLKPTQKTLLLTAPGVDAAFAKALEWKGSPYDFKDIAGMILHRNWSTAGHLICDAIVFRAFEETGNPLVNPKFIPRYHLTPRDVLLSPMVSELKEWQ